MYGVGGKGRQEKMGRYCRFGESPEGAIFRTADIPTRLSLHTAHAIWFPRLYEACFYGKLSLSYTTLNFAKRIA